MGQKPVKYEYRCLNRTPRKFVRSSDSGWKTVTLRDHPNIESRLAEIRSFEYDGRPVYEIRALYVHPYAEQESK